MPGLSIGELVDDAAGEEHVDLTLREIVPELDRLAGGAFDGGLDLLAVRQGGGDVAAARYQGDAVVGRRGRNPALDQSEASANVSGRTPKLMRFCQWMRAKLFATTRPRPMVRGARAAFSRLEPCP